MMHEWKKKLMHEELPLPGGMAGMCGYGCMMPMMMMMFTLNINARA